MVVISPLNQMIVWRKLVLYSVAVGRSVGSHQFTYRARSKKVFKLCSVRTGARFKSTTLEL